MSKLVLTFISFVVGLANQEKVTAENIAKAELQVQRLVKGGSGGAKAEQPVSAAAAVPNGKAEKQPSESALTANGDEASDAAVSEVLGDKAEDAKSNEGAAAAAVVVAAAAVDTVEA